MSSAADQGGGRARVRVAGPVHAVRAVNPGGRPVLRAELGAGEEGITLIWLGRTHIPGIEPGRTVTVEGRLSMQRGRRTMFNPRYDLVAESAGVASA